MLCGISCLVQSIWCSVYFLYLDRHFLIYATEISSMVLLKVFSVSSHPVFHPSSQIWSLLSVPDALDVLCLGDSFGSNIFFDWATHLSYLVFNAWDSISSLVLYGLGFPLRILLNFLNFTFPLLPQFEFSLVILFLLPYLDHFSSFHFTLSVLISSLLRTGTYSYYLFLKSLFCALVALHFSGATVVVDGFHWRNSCLYLIVNLYWYPSIWVWDSCNSRWLYYLVLILLGGCPISWFLFHSVNLSNMWWLWFV